jgi:hypothetical protein
LAPPKGHRRSLAVLAAFPCLRCSAIHRQNIAEWLATMLTRDRIAAIGPSASAHVSFSAGGDNVMKVFSVG